MSEPATTTAGIYCKTCGYDLRGSLEGGRCPECGRGFSPEDPRTFRPRPFAAPWKRALRWAKRAAILLLAVVLTLAGAWGWLYWQWKQEGAALVAMNVSGTSGYPADWEAQVARRAGPAGFVFKRILWLQMPDCTTDADLAHLPKLSRLRTVNLEETRVTDAGLVHLRNLRELTSLGLGHTSVTEAGLAHLGNLRHLSFLSLRDSRVADPGLAHIAKFTHLKWLSLRNTPVTDAGLEHLAKLRELRDLQLQGTRVTPAGIARLQAALPGCRIEGP